MILNKTTE
uniref:Uncharacterized protein n=1 Tax=Arundo donax TaxID=35708 RepID=A0A0A9F840_ARUDO